MSDKEETFVEESIDETISQKWWIKDLPSGMPYTDYLTDLYTASNEYRFNNADFVKIYNDRFAEMKDVNRIIYGNKSSIGSVEFDSIVDRCIDYTKDIRTSAYPEGKFCYSSGNYDDNIRRIGELSALYDDASRELDILVAASGEIADGISTFDVDARDRAMEEIPNLENPTATGLPAFEDVEKWANKEKERGAELLSEAIVTDIAIEEAKEAIANLASMMMALTPPTPTAGGGAANEEAEILEMPAPKFHCEDRENLWLWIMATFVHVMNQLFTTITVNAMITAPCKAAGEIFASAPADEPGEGSEKLAAAVNAAGAILAGMFYVDIPFPWIEPPMIKRCDFAEIAEGVLQTFSDPVVGKLEGDSMEIAQDGMKTLGTKEQHEKFLAEIECKKPSLLAKVYKKHECPAILEAVKMLSPSVCNAD